MTVFNRTFKHRRLTRRSLTAACRLTIPGPFNFPCK